VGGVSEGAGAKAGGIPPSAWLLRVTWRWKASWSSERRGSSRGVVGRRASIGPSCYAGILPRRRRADDSGCPKDAEEGNVVAHAHKAHAPAQAREIVACARQTRPSLGPSTRARRSSLDAKRQKRFVVRRSLRYHGWATPREWDEPALGPNGRAQRGSPHATAFARKRRGMSEKEGGRGLPPCEDPEHRFGCSHVVFSCRSRQATSGLE
jgi:hypothetical protein